LTSGCWERSTPVHGKCGCNGRFMIDETMTEHGGMRDENLMGGMKWTVFLIPLHPTRPKSHDRNHPPKQDIQRA
jgi:hypothetical protein